MHKLYEKSNDGFQPVGSIPSHLAHYIIEGYALSAPNYQWLELTGDDVVDKRGSELRNEEGDVLYRLIHEKETNESGPNG